jgi:hypothetical protein
MRFNRFLGGVSFLPMFAPEGGAGSGGGSESGGGAGAGSGDAARAAGGEGAAGSGAGAGDAGGAAAAGAGAAGAAGSGAGEGGAAGATLAGGGSGPGAAAAAAASAQPPFGEKWREDLAGGDADAAKDLAKYTDPKAVYKSLRDLQTKISKGELKAAPAPLAANATDEQKTAWRAANGLPATKDDYVKGIQLPNGVVLGEADKPFLDSFAQKIFDEGGSQAELNRAVGWFYEAQDAAERARTDGDGQFKVQAEVALRTEWGADFAPNMSAFGAFRSQLPEDLQTLLFSARTADGQLVGNHPLFLKIGAALGRELNPAATLVGNDSPNAVVSMRTELADLEKLMGDQRSEYWRGPTAEQKQARYRELQDGLAKMQARGRAA